MEKLELLCVVGETVHGAATRENNLVVLQTIQIELLYDPEIPGLKSGTQEHYFQ